jgi:uncharacterized protein with GYD domain
MNYYLIQLSYTADAWRQQIELTRDHAQRLNAVRALIARLGGSLAQYRFFEGPDAAGGGEPHSVSCKFMSIGKEDLIAMVAMPDQDAGVAFSMAVSAEPGIRDIQMTPIIRWDKPSISWRERTRFVNKPNTRRPEDRHRPGWVAE